MAKFQRQLTEEQLNAITVALVQGKFPTAIGRELGIPRETVRDAAKRPEVATLVAEILAEDAANQAQQVDAVRAEKRRATSKKSSAAHREKAQREGFAAEKRAARGAVAPIRAPGSVNPDGGRILGIYGAPRKNIPGIEDDDGFAVPNRFEQRRRAALRGETPQEIDDELDEAARKLYPEHVPRASVRLAGCTFAYEPEGEGEAKRIAKLIRNEPEVADVPFDDLVAALADVRPGSTFTFEPPPSRQPTRRDRVCTHGLPL
jgi:hypothetical protein